MAFDVQNLSGMAALQCFTYLEMPTADFFTKIREITGCPKTVYVSKAVLDTFIEPLKDQKPTPTEANAKIAGIFFHAAQALLGAKGNQASFSLLRKKSGAEKAHSFELEVFLDGEGFDDARIEIGFTGERELKLRPEKQELTDTQPEYIEVSALSN